MSQVELELNLTLMWVHLVGGARPEMHMSFVLNLDRWVNVLTRLHYTGPDADALCQRCYHMSLMVSQGNELCQTHHADALSGETSAWGVAQCWTQGE